MDNEDLRERLAALPAPPSIGIDPGSIARAGRRRRRRHRVVGGALGSTAVAAAVLTVSLSAALSRSSARLDASLSSPGDPAATSLLVLDGQQPLACGIASVSALSARGGDEKAGTPEAAALREVFAHDPTRGESPQTADNWVLLARQGDSVTFGQRQGAIGLGDTVTETKAASGRWAMSGSGGCGPLGWADGRAAAVLSSYAVDAAGDSLTLPYDAPSSCAAGDPQVRVAETNASVSVLVIPAPPRPGLCGGGGRDHPITVHLTNPLGARPVLDVGRLPAVPLPGLAVR